MTDRFNRLKNFRIDSDSGKGTYNVNSGTRSSNTTGRTGNYRPTGINNFKNTNNKTGPGITKKADQFREDFVRSSADSDSVQDPLYLTFGLNFNFFERIGESESLLPGLLSGAARRYLNNRGDTQRVQKLDYFNSILRRITIDEPWYIQSLNGLDKLMNIDLEKGLRSVSRERITITTLETIDMKVMSMIDAYRSATIDKKFIRTVLPENLKRFDLTVYVIDPRIIIKKEGGGFVVDNDAQGIITLKLYDCEFHFDNFTTFIGNLNNAEIGEPRSHTFDISVGRIYDTYNLPTSYLYGVGGSGYSSDDSNQEYNIISNVFRSNSANLAEVGNERRVVYKPDQVKNTKNVGKLNVEEESDNSITSQLSQPTELEKESNRVNENPQNIGKLSREFKGAPSTGDLGTRSRESQGSNINIENPQLERESLRNLIDN